MIAESAGLVTRHHAGFTPDPSRAVTTLFVPGEETPETRSSAAALIGRVLAMPNTL